jgi:hypothetical protein
MMMTYEHRPFKEELVINSEIQTEECEKSAVLYSNGHMLSIGRNYRKNGLAEIVLLSRRVM